MSWEERLGESIDFISPRGREFSALWQGNDRTKSKKLGSFSPPKRKGTIFQDLDVDSVKYPINFIFDGENHDLISDLFFETCSENGIWTVIHPSKGALSLQLVTITQKEQPITNGNYTEFESEWVEPLTEDQIASSAELAEQIEAQITAINEANAAQLEALADQSLPSTIQALKDAAETTVNAITNGMAAISELSADIARITNAIQRATTTNLANPLVSIQSLASQIQIAAQAPSLATRNISERASSYGNVLNALSEINPLEPTIEGRNSIAVKEVGMSSVVAVLPRVFATGEITTRQEAVTFAENLSDQLDFITNNLDQNQELYNNNLLENQYFSQSQTYTNLVRLVATGIKYLLVSSFDLKVEKKFTLDKPRAPIDITISEYGSLGENDENFDLFIQSNSLKNRDILLLPAGREVVVYV